ncbi:MAG: hypothetical protein EBZ74_00755 [Planctomycetia bacterium]|nr:hypothetical protein [Planctomycetia bacterium]
MSWRRPQAGRGDGSPAAQASPRDSWRTTAGALTARGYAWLVIRRLASSAAVVALVGLLLWQLLSLNRPLPVVACIATTYEPPLVPIRLGHEDAALVETLARSGASLFRSRSISLHNISAEAATAGADRIVSSIADGLAAAKPGGPDKNLVMAYVSMRGGIDVDGRACLIPPGLALPEASLADGRCITVERLLRAARGAVPATTGIVFVLDACQGGLQWPLGIADGGFPPAVEAAVEAAALPRTWVLLPASAGQTAQASLIDGASVFARFFAAGLRGAADGARVGDRDGTVELGELAAYLTAAVDRWTISHHGVRQTPRILPTIERPGRAGDPRLARAESWEAERELAASLSSYLAAAGSAGNRGAAAPVDPWLRERWRVAETLADANGRERPLTWQRYQQLLLRAESLLQSGPAYAPQRRRAETLVERLELELGTDRLPNAEFLPALRLPWIARWNARPRVVGPLATWLETMAGWVTKPGPKPPSSEPPASAVEWNDRANVAWDWLIERIDADDTIDRDALGRWLEILGPAPASVPAEPPQIQAARALHRDGPAVAWQAAPQLPGRLLRALSASRDARFTADLRVDRLVTSLTEIGRADDDRRLAFDLFFLGDAAAVARAEELAEQSLERARVADRQGAALSDVFSSVDRLLDELPWLAAWWSAEAVASRVSALSATDGLGDATVPLAFDWPAAVEATGQFESAVASLTEEPEGGRAGMDELLSRVEARRAAAETAIQPLQDAFRAAQDDLVSSAPDSADTLARIRRILNTPLVRGEPRMRLLARADELGRRFGELLQEEPADLEPLPAPDVGTVVATWMAWRGLVVNPLVPVLTENAAGVPSRPDRPDEFAAACGGQIAEVQRAVTAAGRWTPARTLDAPPELDAGTLSTLRREEFYSRNLAPLICTRSSIDTSPHSRLSYIDWHDRLVSSAEDALDDFWFGIEPTDGGRRGGGRAPWCVTAARVLVDKAAELLEYARLEYGSLRRRDVAARLATFADGGELDVGSFGTVRLQPRTLPVIRAQPGDLPLNTVTLRPRSGVPAGMASLWFAESIDGPPLAIAEAGPGGPRPRLPLPVNAGREESSLAWWLDADAVAALEPAAGRPGEGRVLDMVAWFRGHRMVVAAPLAPPAALRVMTWEAGPPAAPRVSVRGALPRNQTVAVIFDCSGSMGQRLPDGRTRLEAGRTAVSEVLEQIAIEGGWTASLWLYGHRTKWSRDQRGRYSAGLTEAGTRDRDRTAAVSGTNATLVPGNDVEQVLDPQPLVPLQVTRIRGLLDALEPGGETPLYLAINEALRVDFAARDPGPGHVLVVTDGANDQTGGRITSSADVLRTLARLNMRRGPQDRVRIDVIGFDLAPGMYDRQVRLQDLQSLAADSGGVYYDATDPGRLTAALRSSLQVSRWRVEGGRAPRDSAALGEAILLPAPVEGATDTYDVVLDAGAVTPRRRVSVQGGEGLELFVGGRGRELQFRRYDGGTEQGIRDAAGPLPDPAGPGRTWFIAAHLARRDGRVVTFPVSLQNGVADGFSPRPVEMWATLQPVGPGGPVGLPYVFSDMRLQPARPVPVIDLEADDWPETATSAQIKAWFRFDAAEPEVSLPVNGFIPGVERTVGLEGLPGSSLRVLVRPLESPSVLRMTVVEDHPPAVAAALPLLRIAVGPGCRRAVHLLAPGGSRVRHDFTLAAIDGQVPGDVTLTATRAEAIKRGAVGPVTFGGDTKTLQVPVPER